MTGTHPATQAQTIPSGESLPESLPQVEINRLVALFNAGHYMELENQASLLVDRYPDSGFAWKALGTSLQMLGKDALATLQRAAELLPDDAEMHNNLGNALRDTKQFDGAAASFRRALKIKPDYAEIHNNLGNVLQDLGQLDGAVASYRKALEINPRIVEAHNNLGVVLRELRQFDDAVASYQRALEIRPDYAEAYNNLGGVLRDLGRLDGAVACYARALALQPYALQHAIHAYLMLPIIIEGLDVMAAWRERYQAGIAALLELPGCLKEPGGSVQPLSFYLAYHNQDNRSVIESLRRLFRARVPSLTTTAPHVSGWHPPANRGQRIRVGFLSEFLVMHTIGKLYQGFIRHLDRSRFEVVVIHTLKSKQDGFRQKLDELADKVVTLPAHLEGQQQAVAAEKLDVLFYPDIGMTPSTYFLAYARLAPVQAVSYGHPDTTGLDTVDYFVSAASIESEDADSQYIERLIRLNRLPCFYQPLFAPTQIPSRAAMGLPEGRTLYGCPQTLFKLHPDFDAVLASIAEGDTAGCIVLLDDHSACANLLKARWAKTFPVLLERVLFLPTMSMERFMALMAHIDVLLDPIHFGSGNTMYEGMVYGTPVVTWPGQFMRGRIVAGAYRQMGVDDAPIAARLDDYAPLAIALGREPERRKALRQKLLDAAGRELFEDIRAVREFESFLEAAVAAAGEGQKLPVGWRPKIGQQ